MQPYTPAHQIIVIGASTGGLQALRELLGHFPNDLNASVFITMHIGGNASSLPHILAKDTSLGIGFAEPHEKIKNGRIYVAPPDRHLLIENDVIQVVRSAKENHARPAIDPMFRSAAISHRNMVIGVILTGEMDDGIVGLQAVKVYGGLALVQDPATAEAPSMPESALRHVEVDACRSVAELGKIIVQTVQERAAVGTALSMHSRIEPFATENELTFDLSAGAPNAVSQVGAASGMSCPECGGALWEIGASPPRYRCHTGHSYTAAALFQSQNKTMEDALWVAIRALHEKQTLLDQLAERSKCNGRSKAVDEYELAREELNSHSAVLRELIANLR
ncbi:chemotaxis protein CheB [Pseudomonas sp. R1-6]|uniref:chemotaxis protein CheB n=1 Tax=unclassified Pseudomonas TaxID=196821 RepID=UPI003DA9232E